MQPQPAQEWFSVSDVARRLGLHRSTVYRRIDDGIIAAVSFGPLSLRISAEELRRWEQRGRTGRK